MDEDKKCPCQENCGCQCSNCDCPCCEKVVPSLDLDESDDEEGDEDEEDD